MFAVEMLPAGHGDALVVEYGTPSCPHQLLIDTGTYHAWAGVRSALMRRRRDRYELLIVTHVDEDHIGGAIALLDDPNLKQRIDRIWFNGFVHCESSGNVLGPVNGEQLTRRIREGGFQWNQEFTPKISRDVGGPVVVRSRGPLPVIELPGKARIVLLSPSSLQLKAMARKWEEDVVKAGLVRGSGDSRHTTSPTPRDRAFDPLPEPLDPAALKLLAARKGIDSSVANGSCIAFILEYGERRVLFGADAHASALTKGLGRYAHQVGEPRPRIDLVKLSHHGSNANLSMKMLSLIDCRRWLISTNGDNFAHPDDAAIAKVITSSDKPMTFYCNYRTARTTPWEQLGLAVGATFKFPSPKMQVIRIRV